MTVNDAFLFGGSHPSVNVGDVIMLNAGTLTSALNFSVAAPTSRAYDTFIIEDGGTIRSTAGVSAATVVPEPQSLALLAVGLFGVIALRTRRAKG
jgi:hypothetical protein